MSVCKVLAMGESVTYISSGSMDFYVYVVEVSFPPTNNIYYANIRVSPYFHVGYIYIRIYSVSP